MIATWPFIELVARELENIVGLWLSRKREKKINCSHPIYVILVLRYLMYTRDRNDLSPKKSYSSF